jgi:hypothetical protein
MDQNHRWATAEQGRQHAQQRHIPEGILLKAE